MSAKKTKNNFLIQGSILAIAAIIIIAAVWYYAMQGTHIDEDK